MFTLVSLNAPVPSDPDTIHSTFQLEFISPYLPLLSYNDAMEVNPLPTTEQNLTPHLRSYFPIRYSSPPSPPVRRIEFAQHQTINLNHFNKGPSSAGI
ncbi:hypothetical protein GWI33_017087 [Rhynchophorus ferrugineus]|uniref:Uncharacterized protein n=1 Tax=Rhynchophorus ferrugineus TaxID=354439 RepID=A0A834HW60_RHYFE|nr:hypothetical protein GWI33_017087 [Rhynchophorus ferrugineus]